MTPELESVLHFPTSLKDSVGRDRTPTRTLGCEERKTTPLAERRPRRKQSEWRIARYPACGFLPIFRLQPDGSRQEVPVHFLAGFPLAARWCTSARRRFERLNYLTA